MFTIRARRQRNEAPNPFLRNILALLCFICPVIPGTAADAIVNYEHDEDLEKAMSFTYWGEDPTKASRDRAEQYYLKYVQRSANNEQNARVYVILGCLYSSAARPANGEARNDAKAAEYFRQALDADPRGISRVLITARHHVACFPREPMERLKAHLRLIEYLNGLSASDIETGCRPLTPDGDKRVAVRAAAAAVSQVKLAAEDNAMALAGGTPMPAAMEGDITSDLMLQEIVGRFPGTPFADKAKARLDEIAQRRIDSMLDESTEHAFEHMQTTTSKEESKAPIGAVGTSASGNLGTMAPDGGCEAIGWALIIFGVIAVIGLGAVAIAAKRRRAVQERGQ